MPGATTKYAIPYPLATDPVADGDDRIKALAERVDLMMGEKGTDTITPSAVDTTTTKRINYGRTYPTAPQVFVGLREAPSTTSQNIYVWPTAEDTTGFTLNIRSTSASARVVGWLCRP